MGKEAAGEGVDGIVGAEEEAVAGVELAEVAVVDEKREAGAVGAFEAGDTITTERDPGANGRAEGVRASSEAGAEDEAVVDVAADVAGAGEVAGDVTLGADELAIDLATAASRRASVALGAVPPDDDGARRGGGDGLAVAGLSRWEDHLLLDLFDDGSPRSLCGRGLFLLAGISGRERSVAGSGEHPGPSDDGGDDGVGDDGSNGGGVLCDGPEDFGKPFSEGVLTDWDDRRKVLKAAGVELKDQGVVRRARAAEDDEVSVVGAGESLNEVPDGDGERGLGRKAGEDGAGDVKGVDVATRRVGGHGAPPVSDIAEGRGDVASDEEGAGGRVDDGAVDVVESGDAVATVFSRPGARIREESGFGAGWGGAAEERAVLTVAGGLTDDSRDAVGGALVDGDATLLVEGGGDVDGLEAEPEDAVDAAGVRRGEGKRKAELLTGPIRGAGGAGKSGEPIAEWGEGAGGDDGARSDGCGPDGADGGDGEIRADGDVAEVEVPGTRGDGGGLGDRGGVLDELGDRPRRSDVGKTVERYLRVVERVQRPHEEVAAL